MSVEKKENPLWDPKLSVEEKIDYLLGELTLEEKFNLISSGSAGVERLGVKDLRLGGEAAHGVEARNDQNGIGEADITTSFPQPVGMSSSWDTEAIKAAGSVVGRESRIVYNKRPWGGISRWAPTVDLLRDPRWGRNEEAYGEDPVQVGAMASSYIKGIQGDDPDHLMAAATLKHFYANNTEIGRIFKNSSISPRNKYELYLEPFRRCIEDGRAEGVMTAYNRINGVQGLFNDEVNTLLKDEFGLTHAVSDGGAMELCAAASHTTSMDAETAAISLKAGVDALSGRPQGVYEAVSEAYELGLITEEDLDTAIRNVYRTKIKLGIFDERKEDLGKLCSDEASKICKELTDSSLVLLKNDGILPLDKSTLGNTVLIGPVGNAWYQDWYGGEAPEHVSVLDGLNESIKKAGMADETVFVDGCDRICLKSKDGYLAVVADGRVRLSDTPDVFIIEDWGEESYTLKHELTGNYLTCRLSGEAIIGIAAAEETDDTARIACRVYGDAKRIFSWFDLEIFRFGKERDPLDPEGRIILRDRFGNRIYADNEGYLVSAKDNFKELTSLSFKAEKIRDGIDEAVKAASNAGTVILALGHNPMINAKEEVDRATISFIPYQQKLFDEIYKVNRNISVVLMSDYPFAVNEINERARAILWSATGSQCMGRSIADALTGDIHPAGRVAQTWFGSDDDLPTIDDYDIIGRGRTYRYFERNVLYPFGYGLTYTRFKYSDLKVDIEHLAGSGTDRSCIGSETGRQDAKCRRSANRGIGRPAGVYDNVRNDDRLIKISLCITNEGDMTSDEVVQIYAKAPEGRVKKPSKQLVGFSRVKNIMPGETRDVKIEIPIRELAYYDVISESLIIEEGSYEIMAGSSSLDIRGSVSIGVEGTIPGLRDMTKKIKADHFDEESGSQIVEGMYGFSALMVQGDDVYVPRNDGFFSATYRNCDISEDADTLRIHGYAPENADLKIFVDDKKVSTFTLNTREYERRPSEARNHMPRAFIAENLRKRSWPLLWADIYVPLDLGGIESLKDGHTLRIEVTGPFKYDWFSIISAKEERG